MAKSLKDKVTEALREAAHASHYPFVATHLRAPCPLEKWQAGQDRCSGCAHRRFRNFK